MIRVEIGTLSDRAEEAVMRPIRSDLAPSTVASRDLGLKAGTEVARRLEAGGRIPVGGAVLTRGGGLPAAYIIHVVVSAEDEPQTPMSVRRALENGLRRATDCGVSSMALPPLGISVGTLEAEEEARTLVDVLGDHLDAARPPLDFVVVVANTYEEQIFSGLVSARTHGRDHEGG